MHERTCQIFTFKTCWHRNDVFEKDAKITLKQFMIDVRFFVSNIHVLHYFSLVLRKTQLNYEKYFINNLLAIYVKLYNLFIAIYNN